MNISHEKLQIYFFIALFGVVIALLIGVFFPFISILAIAGALAVVFQPVMLFLQKIFFNSKITAVILTVILAIIIIAIPISIFGTVVFKEIQNVYGFISGNENIFGIIQTALHKVIPGIDFKASFDQAVAGVTGSLSSIFSTTAKIIIYFILGLIAFFYFLKDGKNFVDILLRLSPLKHEYDHKILVATEKAINSIIRGSLVVALVQGVMTGVGFWIFGVPNPALWGSITIIAALVPTIGTGLVTIPAAIFLFTTGNTFAGIGLLIWGLVGVGLIDNLLGPILIGRGVNIHPFLIILSVLGGLSFFGLAGFLLGPLVLSLFFALSELYSPILKQKKLEKIKNTSRCFLFFHISFYNMINDLIH